VGIFPTRGQIKGSAEREAGRGGGSDGVQEMGGEGGGSYRSLACIHPPEARVSRGARVAVFDGLFFGQ
jgi:hypothetical protein